MKLRKKLFVDPKQTVRVRGPRTAQMGPHILNVACSNTFHTSKDPRNNTKRRRCVRLLPPGARLPWTGSLDAWRRRWGSLWPAGDTVCLGSTNFLCLRPNIEVKLCTQSADKWICMGTWPVSSVAECIRHVLVVPGVPEFFFPTRTVPSFWENYTPVNTTD